MKPRHLRRSFSFVVMVFVLLHLCGASGTLVPPNIVRWYAGPCSLSREMNRPDVVIACFDRNLVRLAPPGFVNEAIARHGETNADH